MSLNVQLSKDHDVTVFKKVENVSKFSIEKTTCLSFVVVGNMI